MMDLSVMLAVVELVAIVVVISLDPSHMNHFTWWGLVSYAVFISAYIGYPGLENRIWGVCAIISLVILVGVILISILGCGLLTATLKDLGGSQYILGNFAVHYWPALRLWFLRPSDQSSRLFYSQLFFGLTFPLTYLSIFKAEDVYGCSVSRIGVLVASLGGIPLSLGLRHLYLVFRSE